MTKKLAIYDDATGRIEALDPANATGIHVPTARIVNRAPPVGTVEGELVFETTTGVAKMWTGSTWSAIQSDFLHIMADDSTILQAQLPPGHVAISQDTGNMFINRSTGWAQWGVRTYTDRAAMMADSPADNSIAIADNKMYVRVSGTWVGMPVQNYTTEADLQADTPPDGTIGFAEDTGLAFGRAQGAWRRLNSPTVTVGTAPITPATGDIYLNTTTEVTSIYDGGKWVVVAPPPPPVGQIIMYPSMTPPSGYLLCNGAAIDQNLYPRLHALLGGTLPDLRDKFVRGANSTNDCKGRSTHNDTTRMPRSRFTTAGAGSHVHDIAVGNKGGYQNAVTNYGAINGIVSINNTWVGEYEVRMPGSRIFWSAPDHTHTINGGDSETAPKHVKLAYCIRHD